MKKQQINEAQDITKVVKKDNFLNFLNTLDELEWNKAYKIINDFCLSDIKVSLSILKKIVNLQNKQLIDLFLREYMLFDEKDKKFLEIFVNENLQNDNKEFVSDLIYLANDLNLNIDYQSILNLILINI